MNYMDNKKFESVMNILRRGNRGRQSNLTSLNNKTQGIIKLSPKQKKIFEEFYAEESDDEWCQIVNTKIESSEEILRRIPMYCEELRSNADSLYKEIKEGYDRLYNELVQGRADRSDDEILDELRELEWEYALVCEYYLKSELLMNQIDKVSDLLERYKKEGKCVEVRRVLDYLIKDTPEEFLKLLTGEISKEDLTNQLQGMFSKEAIDSLWTEIGKNNLSMIDYGHDIEKMVDEYNMTNPNNLITSDTEGIDNKIFTLLRYDDKSPKEIADIFPKLISLTDEIVTGTRREPDSNLENLIQGLSMTKRPETIALKTRGDMLFERVNAEYENIKNKPGAEQRKKRLSWKEGLTCEYYLKSILLNENCERQADSFFYQLNNSDRERFLNGQEDDILREYGMEKTSLNSTGRKTYDNNKVICRGILRRTLKQQSR